MARHTLTAMALMLFVSPAVAQVQVVDEWSTVHDVTTADGAPIVEAEDTVDTTGSDILGDERDVKVVKTDGEDNLDVSSTASPTSNILAHSAQSTVNGFSIIVWDGNDNAADNDDTDDNTNDPPTFATPNFTGLSGANLDDPNCPTTDQGLAFQISIPGNGDVDVTFDVFTDGSNWSRLTRTKSATDNTASILEFPQSAFNTQAGSGADFGNVGALRLTIDPAARDEDINIESPILTCLFDLGDAPDDRRAIALGFSGDDEYATTLFSDDVEGFPNLGPHHVNTGPFLGADGSRSADTDTEDNGQSSASSDGDDTDGSDDEQAVVFPDLTKNLTCDGLDVGTETYCATVDVANPTSSDAQLMGWVDFDRGGDSGGNAAFDDACSTTDGSVTDCERSAARVLIGNTGLADAGGGNCSESGASAGDSVGGTDFSTGNVPANCAGTVVLTWDLSGLSNGDIVDETTETFGRVRITTDNNYFSSSGAVPHGFAKDGEVEDNILAAGTLPVSIASFDSSFTGSGLHVEWGTVSETRNVGFHLWGETGDGFQRLNQAMIAARTSDAVTPANYTHVFEGVTKGDIKRIAVTAVDQRGNEKMYGLFEVNRAYGNKTQPVAIDWASVRSETAQRLQARGFVRAGEGWRRSAGGGPSGKSDSVGIIGDSAHRGGAGGVVAVDVRPSAAGMQRVSYQDLADAGLDLAGVDPADIAVTLKGKGVPRHVAGIDAGGPGKGKGGGKAVIGASGDRGKAAGGTFGPGAAIDFRAQAPGYPDALYVGSHVYRITVNADKAVAALSQDAQPKPSPEHYTETVRVNQDSDYSFASPLEDPWYAARLRADSGDDSHTTTLSLDDALRADRPARLTVTLGGLTDFPEAPDHHVQVLLNGQLVQEVEFDGQQVRELQAEVPQGLLQTGTNSVEVRLPGGTAAETDIVLLDTVELEYPRSLRAASNWISIDSVENTGGLTVAGFTDTDTVAYGFDGESLWTLPQEHFNRGSLRVPTVGDKGTQYWISTSDRMRRPEVLGSVSQQDMLADPANYLIIAHPSFLPQSAGSDHQLNTYIAQRESEGWDVGLFDLSAIQAQYGHGMALPEAVTNFLREADQRFDYSHVLLVGDDSYDYRDHLGLGSVSFIPTTYTATSNIPHTPSDALLADLDGDGVSDKAVGRWPVRSETDLDVIVQKTLDWQADMDADASALWVTDSEDSASQSFQAQAERMIDPLEQAGWTEAAIERVYFDQVQPGPNQTPADAARQAMIAALNQGKTMTGFVGHGAPTMWTFQGLLTPDDVSAIENEGMPTLIGTLTCYTSYFVSPHTDTLAHRLMNGYREDAGGEPIPGVANGAVAIHGAATLSGYNDNERFAKAALEAQLVQGATLGEAIRLARLQAASQGLSDVVRNWTLLGDPTLLLQ